MGNLVGGRLIWILLLLCTALVVSSSAKMGYDVTIDVNSSSWGVHRSTQDMKFELIGSSSGEGSFSRLTRIDGFAGIEADETTYTTYPGSRLSYDERMRLLSREGPVIMLKDLESGTNESTNESRTVINESANIIIDEFWPTYFTNYKKVTYSGRSIRNRECYQNNGDTVSTSINSWDLNKESLYRAHINRSIISVNVTPTSVVETRSANKSSHYNLDLRSVGILTSLEVAQRDRSGNCASCVSQDYMGHQNMTLKVGMTDSVPPLEKPRDWLQCCIAKEPDPKLESAIWRPEAGDLYTSQG